MKTEQVIFNGSTVINGTSSLKELTVPVKLPALQAPDTLCGGDKPVVKKTETTHRKHGKAAMERDGIKKGIRNGTIYYNEAEIKDIRTIAKELVDYYITPGSNLIQSKENIHLMAQLNSAITELPDTLESRWIIYSFHMLTNDISSSLHLCRNDSMFSIQLLTALKKQKTFEFDLSSIVKSLDLYLQQVKKDHLTRSKRFGSIRKDIRPIPEPYKV